MPEPFARSGLSRLYFDHSFTSRLPADPEGINRRRQVRAACYSRVRPQPCAQPALIAYSRETAALLDLSEEDCRSPLFTQVFSGNLVLPGMDPHAACYGGHQFGNWAGQLGDGRAINLGEALSSQGKRLMLQLKGAGPTPYSRQADGLAVLRSSLREFICSEAMFHLGVPTTRALSLIATGEMVERDMFYDGHPRDEPGAVVCRVAPSFLRFGNFELFAAREEHDMLRQLIDYAIETFFPHLGKPCKLSYLAWFEEICQRTAALMVEWLRVGFVHGVMNTDNMSILGLTIDYGPYGWMENYDPAWTPNTTDRAGRRYCFGRQAQIAHWNLAQLANALYPLIDEIAPLEEALQGYGRSFDQGWRGMMAAKLGLAQLDQAGDQEWVAELLALLADTETDMTLFFRLLSQVAEQLSQDGLDSAASMILLRPAHYHPEQISPALSAKFCAWLEAYRQRLRREQCDPKIRRQAMDATNPKYIFRNYMAQLAIDQAEQGNYELVHELLELLRHPYDEQPEKERWAVKRPEWARHRPGCSMLSCSS